MHTPAEKFSKVALNCRWQGYLLTALAEVEGVVATRCEVLEGVVEYDAKLLRVKTSPAVGTFGLDARRICFDSAAQSFYLRHNNPRIAEALEVIQWDVVHIDSRVVP